MLILVLELQSAVARVMSKQGKREFFLLFLCMHVLNVLMNSSVIYKSCINEIKKK